VTVALRGMFPAPLVSGIGAAGLAMVALLAAAVALAPVAFSRPHRGEAATAVGGGPGEVALVPYNGDFTFTRVRFIGAWNHDYPDADRNMQFILEEFTAMHPNTSDSNVLDLEDGEIFRNPVLYLSEPGTWRITEVGARNLRAHLDKGGFMLINYNADLAEYWEFAARGFFPVDPTNDAFRLGVNYFIYALTR